MKQAIVIGLGQFGRALALELQELGFEVIGIDQSKERAQEMSSLLTSSVEADATKFEVLKKFNPASRDIVICALGEDSPAESLLISLLLKQKFHCKNVISRSTDPMLREILESFDITVENPEESYGKALARRLGRQYEEFELTQKDVLTKVSALQYMIGRTVQELNLIDHQLKVIGVQQAGSDSMLSAFDDSYTIDFGDTLFLLGPRGVVSKIATFT